MDYYSYLGFTSGVDTQTTWISYYGLDDLILPLDKIYLQSFLRLLEPALLKLQMLELLCHCPLVTKERKESHLVLWPKGRAKRRFQQITWKIVSNIRRNEESGEGIKQQPDLKIARGTLDISITKESTQSLESISKDGFPRRKTSISLGFPRKGWNYYTWKLLFYSILLVVLYVPMNSSMKSDVPFGQLNNSLQRQQYYSKG